MAVVSKNTPVIAWEARNVILTIGEIYLLFEIYGPFPVIAEFTLRSGLIGLGKSRTLVGNQDQLLDILYGYINEMDLDQQLRVRDLIHRWSKIDTKVIKFDSAERVRFRVNAPEEQRKLILKRLQTYIPIYRTDEVEGYNQGFSGNEILRG